LAKEFESGSGNNVAYILVKCKLGLEEKVINSLKRIDGVAEVERVYGTPYDIIVKVECDTPKKFEAVVWRVRRVDRVISTQTLLVAAFQNNSVAHPAIVAGSLG
jgi:DNA-binding Lrp family transcriptional regulator